MIKLVTIVLLTYSLSASAQVIKGRVLESGTDTPIPHASIYFDGMYKGTTSDAQGYFQISLPSAKSPVIVSSVGYYSATIAEYSSEQFLKVYLKPKVYSLDAVIIGFDGMTREEKEAVFKKEFVGTSPNALKCNVMNINDVSLVYDKKANTLEAFCDKPILLQNKTLGYKITYYLEKFIKTDKDVYFSGNYYFETDSTISARELRKISRRREYAYLGSRMHFIRSLWANNLIEEGYRIYNNTSPITADSILVITDSIKNIRIKDRLTVIYKDQYIAPSWLKNTKDPVYIDKNGFYDPSGISWSGYMANQRIGDCLPFEYLYKKNSTLPQDAQKGELHTVISSVNAFTANLATERLYLHTDKSAYQAGDTLWFKGYLFNQALTNATVKSQLLYIELADDSNAVVKRMIAPVYRGLTFGQIPLEGELPQGGYTLRAYTQYMRNFGEDYVFRKHFYLSKAAANQWLITYRPGLVRENGKEALKLGLQLTRFDHIPVGLRELQLRLTDGRRTLLKQNTSTDADGRLTLNYTLPEKINTQSLTLTLQDQRKGEDNRILQAPILLNRPEHTDVQFMPEGGNLVAGLPAHVAFKAVGENGKGTNIAGTVHNNNQEEVAKFTSEHNGMGSFKLQPQSGESYTAKIKLNDGTIKTYPLPQVQFTGTTLHIADPLESDSCTITIMASPDVAAANHTYYLIGQARGKACYGASFNFSKEGVKKLQVSKSTFPTGIVRFTLSEPDSTALNERIIYIDHQDKLDIQLKADKKIYKTRDSVSLILNVSDEGGNPVQGSFSLAVTDDSQVKTDSIMDETIVSRMLLTGDLRGTIEDPGYYANPTASEARCRHLDQLLLTQGWVGYDWQDIFHPKPLTYPAEQEYTIKGKVLNMFNKPVSNSAVTLLSRKPLLVKDTIANEQGQFTFKNLTPSDTTIYFIQSKNRQGKSFNTGIEVEEFQPPVFTESSSIHPWYVNADTSRLQAIRQQVRLTETRDRIIKGRVLKEVVVKAKKIVKDSKNLNGPGEADIVIDEEDLKKAGKKTLGDLIRENVKGFVQKGVGERIYYTIDGMFAYLIIDGVRWFFPMRWEEMPMKPGELFKHYLDFYNAEDIKGIEVITSGKYQPAYSAHYVDPKAPYYRFAFIEVTTRSGDGPTVTKTPGTYLYKPQSFILPKKFYTPKYSSSGTSPLPDIRSTIHWEPNVVTDKDGRATVTFYTADTPGSYSLILEGTDMRGNLGVQRAKITIEK